MKGYLIFIMALGILLTLHFYNKVSLVDVPNVSLNNALRNFSTARGTVDIEEINTNVFETYDYLLVKNNLIPILKKKYLTICENVFRSWQKVADKGLTIDPPKDVPNYNEFLLNNYTRLYQWYFNETQNKSVRNWTGVFVDDLIKFAKNDPTKVPHSYGDESLAVHAATKHFNIVGQNGAVIGSQKPWAEIYILGNGAKHVTTVDYHKIINNHPQWNFLHALDLSLNSEKYYDNFDFIVSFSSIEHSGLGRYGDPIDPIGDIREMNKIHCLLKPKGLLFLGLPIGADKIAFNAHRIYGRIRLAMMFEGFRILKIFKSQTIVEEKDMELIFNDENHEGQYLFVLEKMEKKI